jgi:flagella basal body P-ring formation protein FlgA
MTMRTILLASLFLAAAGSAVGEDVAVASLPTLLPPPDVTTPAAKIATVPVLKQAVQKGETITAENITMQQIPASQAFASTITDANELAGQQAIRPLIAGAPVNRLHVRVAPVISRNQSVTFIYRKGGVELSGRGQSLDDGQVGQSVRIINTATRSTIIGTVNADGTVEMN